MEQTLTFIHRAGSPLEKTVPRERLAVLFDAHHQRLYRLARRLSGDPEEARDLVQQAFLAAARRPSSIPSHDTGAEAWMVRTLVNLCRDRKRRLRVRQRAAAWLRPAPGGGDLETATVARATVQAALQELPPRRRAVIVLHELEDKDVAEIATGLGLSRVTVRWHLATGRRDLKRILLREKKGHV